MLRKPGVISLVNDQECCLKQLNTVTGSVKENCHVIASAVKTCAVELCSYSKSYAIHASTTGCYTCTKLTGEKTKQLCYAAFVPKSKDAAMDKL